MLAAFEFTGPDRIPVVYTPSPAGLYVHGQKLLDLFAQYPPDNPLNVESFPAPPPDAIDRDGRYYEVRTDPWGTEAEHRIFGVWGIPSAILSRAGQKLRTTDFRRRQLSSLRICWTRRD